MLNNFNKKCDVYTLVYFWVAYLMNIPLYTHKGAYVSQISQNGRATHNNVWTNQQDVSERRGTAAGRS